MQIKNYIQTQLNNGYTIEVIKSALIHQGFNSIIVNKISSDINNVNINIRHEVNISKGTIIGIVATIFIVGLIVFGVLNFSMFKPKESLMDVTITNTAYSYLPGETINYQLHITSMGSTQRFDASIKYAVVDAIGNVITSKEETIAIETTVSVNRDMQLPIDIKPGKYYIQAIAEYNNKQAKSQSEFEIVENATEKKPPTYNSPTQNSIPSSNIEQKNNKLPSTLPSIANTGKTFGTVLTETRQTALSNPASAAAGCSILVSSEQKDICYSTVADGSQQSSYCDKVNATAYRDNCYLGFVMNGKLDVCDKITSTSDKSFCDQLSIIQLMDEYYKENNTEKMLELNQKFNPTIIQNNTPQIQTYEYVYNEPVSIEDVINNASIEQEPIVNITIDNSTAENITIEDNSTITDNVTV